MAKKAASPASPAPSPPLGLDDAPLHPMGESSEAERARQGDAGRPYCGRHLCLMVSTGSDKDKTRYKCPVPGCSCSQTVARPIARIPREPRRCPQKICKDKPEAYLEVDPRSQGMTLTLRCPCCGHTQQEPRPMAHAQLQRIQQQQAEPVEDLSAR